MGKKPVVPAAEVADMLTAICEALTLPHTTWEYERARTHLSSDRAQMVRDSIRGITPDMIDGSSRTVSLAWFTDYLRKKITELPVTYPLLDEARQAGEDGETR